MKHIKLFESFLNESVYDTIPVITKKDMNRDKSEETVLGKYDFDTYTLEVAYHTPAGGIPKDMLGDKYRLEVSIYKDKGKKFIDSVGSFTYNSDLIKMAKEAKTPKDLARMALEFYLESQDRPRSYKEEPGEFDDTPVNIDAVQYTKKRGKEHVQELYEMLKELHDFNPNPTKRNLSIDRVESELKTATGIVDAYNGLTALWMFDTFYVYALPEEVFDKNEFTADNERFHKYKTAEGDYEYLVVVLV